MGPKPSIKELRSLLREATRAVEKHPDMALAHVMKGDALHSLERYEEAMESFEQALGIDADRPEAHIAVVKTLIALSRFSEAESRLKIADRLLQNPKDEKLKAESQQGWDLLREAQRGHELNDPLAGIFTEDPTP